MISRRRDDDPTLAPWTEIEEYTNWTGLLVGNGSSVAIWPDFRYSSLFEVATSDDIADPLTADDDQTIPAERFERHLGGLDGEGQ
jgi:hypothetical protein